MKNSKKFNGQIMVIVLLFLAVLTIIAVGVTLNTSRDTKEQVADKQYQQYYSVGERVIVDLINFIGKDSLTSLTNGPGGSIEINSLNYNCNEVSSAVNCTISQIPSTYFNESGTAETLTSVIKIEDISEIDEPTTGALMIKKDQDLLFDFAETGGWNTFDFSWADDSGSEAPFQTAWNLSYDYYDANSNTYKTEKLVWDQSSGNIYSESPDNNQSFPNECFQIDNFEIDESSNPSIQITYNESVCPNPLFLRLKPIMKNSEGVKITKLTFDGTSGAPIARKIISTTTTKDSGNTDSPSAVLETIYFLGKTPLSLFDYVLRTEDSIVKQ